MDHPKPEQMVKRRALGLKHAQEVAKKVVRPPDALRKETKLLQNDDNANSLSNHNDVHWKSSGGNVQDNSQGVITAPIETKNMTDNLYENSVQSTVLIPVPQGEQVNDDIDGISSKHEDLKNENTTEASKFHQVRVVECGDENAKKTSNIDILAKTQLNVNAPEFISSQKGPFVTREEDSLPEASTSDAATGINEYDFVIGLLRDTVFTLTFSPGHYDMVIENLLETLQMFISTAETMEGVVQIIIEQAIKSQNFVYTAVKLIKLFLEKLVNSEISFKKYFYLSLRKVFDEMPGLIKDRDNPMSHSRAFGIAMLFAELLCNVKAANGELNIAFSKAVFSNIDFLLEKPTEEMVQTLIKLIKLTGPTLDEHKSLDMNIRDVDGMFEKFRELSCDSTWLSHLDNHKDLRARVLGIYRMHTRDWDRTPARPVDDFTVFPSPSAAYDNQSTAKVDWNEYCGPEDLDEGEEYDDEFEQFLKESKQI